MKRILLVLLAAAQAPVSGLSARQRYPWNGLVDVSLTLADGAWRYDLSLAATNAATGEALPVATVYPRGGAAGDALRFSPGEVHLVWDAGTDVPESVISNVSFTVSAAPVAEPPIYVIVDLSGGTNAASYPVTKLTATPAGGFNTDEYKTTKLALRRIEPGTFTMGSPAGEIGRSDGWEDQHQVTISKAFYIGLFELTQKQWELVMGNKPSSYAGDARPVERVSYNDLRGSSAGAGWPASDEVDATSFFGRLRARTSYRWDLPTEAQWEYACRAGTTTALNSGKDLSDTIVDSNMAEVGRYDGNHNDGKGEWSEHVIVGSYAPNAWGLYDMHGNVFEWCLDKSQSSLGTGVATDPKGAASGSFRVSRGGSWASFARDCRSASRNTSVGPSVAYGDLGFRPSMVLPGDE